MSTTRAPRAIPAACWPALPIAATLVVPAVVGVHDLLASLGATHDPAWMPRLLGAADGLGPSMAVLAVATVVGLTGLALILIALRPARRTHVQTQASGDVWISGTAVGALAQTVADRFPGVVSASLARATPRRVDIRVVTDGDPAQTRTQIRDVVTAHLSGLAVPTVRIRTRKLAP